MTNSEWVELFYSKSYETQINDLLLNDWDYEIPRDSMLNYVRNIISIPYEYFISKLDSTSRIILISEQDIPQFVSFNDSCSKLISYLLEENNRGILPGELGQVFNTTFSDTKNGHLRYGIAHLRSAQIMGLVYEYFGSWYLNCVCYIFDELSPVEQNAFIARMLLRSSLYKKIFSNIISSNFSIYSLLDSVSPAIVDKYFLNIGYFFQICLNEHPFKSNIGRIFEYESIKNRIINRINDDRRESQNHKCINEKSPFETITGHENYLDLLQDYEKYSSKRLKIFVETVQNYKVFSQRETDNIFIKSDPKSNSKIRDIIFKGHLYLVLQIAKTYVGQGVEIEDIIRKTKCSIILKRNVFFLKTKCSHQSIIYFT